MDGERVTNDEARVDEVKAVVEKPEAEKPASSVYDDFVEGVASREIAKAQGATPERMARVFQSSDKDGEPVIHLAGEGKVVSGIGDILERGGYNVQEWHIKRPDDVAKEGEKVRPALDSLIKSVPVPVLDNPEAFIRKALGLPVRAIEAGAEVIEQAVDKLAAEGSPFQQLGESLQNEVKGGSESGKE